MRSRHLVPSGRRPARRRSSPPPRRRPRRPRASSSPSCACAPPRRSSTSTSRSRTPPRRRSTSRGGSSSTASPRAGRSRVGTDGDPLGAGTKLPAGQTFVFGKNAGDYTGTADATYNFQVTEAGGFLIKDAGAVTQDAVGAPGTACAEGTGPDLPHDRRGLHLHPQGGRCRAAGHRRQRRRLRARRPAPPTAPPAAQPCEAPPTPLAIDAIQGSGATSPRNGQLVQITGVVIGVDNQQGVSNFVNLDPRQAGHLRRDADLRPGREPRHLGGDLRRRAVGRPTARPRTSARP